MRYVQGHGRARSHAYVAAALVLALLPSGRVPCSEAAEGSFEFSPGVLVAGDRGVCFLMNTANGVDAVDVETGRVRWTTEIAEKPLMIVDGDILAQEAPEPGSDLLQLVLLDASTGEARSPRIDVQLPRGVHPMIDQGAASSFSLDVWEDNGSLVVSWSYSEAPLRGAAPATRDGFEAHGAARIDLSDWAVSVVPPGQVITPPSERLPEPLVYMTEAGTLPGTLWRTDGVYATVLSTGHGEGRRGTLKRWNAADGDSLPDVTLFRGNYVVRYPSADGRDVLASRALSSNRGGAAYEWRVFSLETGAPVAELIMDLPAARFFVAGSLLVFQTRQRVEIGGNAGSVEPPALRAVNVDTGETIWTHPFRDTKYHGPLPPDR
jgi:hypothetical protein